MTNKIQNYLKISKSIKYFCLITAFITIIVMSYFIFANQNNKIRQDISASDKIENEEAAQVQINSPDLIGRSLEHGPYFIKAEEMQEYSSYLSFIKPVINLMLNHIDWLNVTSNTAKLSRNDNHLELFNDVRANFNKYYYFIGEQAEILKNESLIKSNSYSKIYTDEYNLESDNGFIINYQDQTGFFVGKINANLQRENNSSVTNIKSNSLDVYWHKKTGDFIGNVILTKDGTIVKADKMTAIIKKNSNELEKVRAYGNVRISDKENIATGEYGEYIVATEILTLKENVKLYKSNSEFTGELLHYNFKNKKADLVGLSGKNNGRTRAIIIPTKKHE